MLRLMKFLLYLLVLVIIGVAGFAYLGDLSPRSEERRVPVSLDAQ